MLDELDRQRAELKRAQERLADLTARAVSADRLVSVTVNSRGLLVDLQIAPAALRRYRSEQLASSITGLVVEADATLAAKRTELLSAAAVSGPGLADIRTELERDVDA